MKSATRIAVLGLLLALAAGCNHKAPKIAPSQAAQAPSLPPAQMAALIPVLPPPMPSVAEVPIKLDTALPPEKAEVTAPAHPRRPTRHHTKAQPEPAQQEAAKSAPPPPAQTPAEEAQIASGQQPSEESPIGQLSTANDNSNTADRRAIVDLINSIETGLHGIRRPLSSDEQKTVLQVKTFVTRARAALKADDLDGARTLSTKAHLLLQELTKE